MAAPARVALAPSPAAKGLAVVALGIYIWVNVPLAWINVRSFQDRGEKIQAMVEGVVEQHCLYPGQPVILSNVEPDLFWSAIVFRPFRLWGIDDVYVSAASRPAIEASQPGQDIAAFFEP